MIALKISNKVLQFKLNYCTIIIDWTVKNSEFDSSVNDKNV